MEHLLAAWQNIQRRLRAASRILLLSDYDGTLTPIVERPEMAVLPQETKRLIQDLVDEKCLVLGIISGRALADLKMMVPIRGVVYAGNHGMEIEGPGISFINPLAEEMKPILHLLYAVLSRSLSAFKGVLVEDKGLTLSVHYRRAEESKTEGIANAFERTVAGPRSLGKIKTTQGKKVHEVRPAVDWDKGKAINLLMKRFGKAGRKGQLLPIYLGDDTTDEDGFSAIRHYGEGISVCVGDGSRGTAARYYLESPAEVETFLSMLLEWCRRNKR